MTEINDERRAQYLVPGQEPEPQVPFYARANITPAALAELQRLVAALTGDDGSIQKGLLIGKESNAFDAVDGTDLSGAIDMVKYQRHQAARALLEHEGYTVIDKGHYNDLQNRAAALKQALEALEWYADEDHYDEDHAPVTYTTAGPWFDNGEKARKAIAALDAAGGEG